MHAAAGKAIVERWASYACAFYIHLYSPKKKLVASIQKRKRNKDYDNFNS
jgi:hypothetical protein